MLHSTIFSSTCVPTCKAVFSSPPPWKTSLLGSMLAPYNPPARSAIRHHSQSDCRICTRENHLCCSLNTSENVSFASGSSQKRNTLWLLLTTNPKQFVCIMSTNLQRIAIVIFTHFEISPLHTFKFVKIPFLMCWPLFMFGNVPNDDCFHWDFVLLNEVIHWKSLCIMGVNWRLRNIQELFLQCLKGVLARRKSPPVVLSCQFTNLAKLAYRHHMELKTKVKCFCCKW